LGAGEYSGAPELTDAPLPPGTTRYRSPEAARFLKAHRDDPSARYDFPPEDDFYSLAVCLYDALTDAEPALKAAARKAPRLNVNSPTLAPSPARKVNPRVPEEVSAWVERWLVRDVETRRPALAAMPGALEELAKQGGAEWRASVQPPPEAGTPAPEHPLSRKRRRVLAWAVAAGVLAVLAALAWLRAGPSPAALPSRAAPEAPRPPQAPALGTPPAPSAPSPSAVPSQSQVSPNPKESPSVSAPTNPPPSPSAVKKPKKAAPVFSPEFLKQCAMAGASAAALMGCPGAQVTPTRETCPEEAVRAARRRGLEHDETVGITVDANRPCPPGKGCFVTLSDGPIESVVQEGDGRSGMPEGTRLYGQVWTGGDEVVIRYTRAVIPPEVTDNYYVEGTERDFPICAVLGFNGGAEKEEGSKPGAARVVNYQVARIIHGQWP
jgi:serine/threonine-protein kinase